MSPGEAAGGGRIRSPGPTASGLTAVRLRHPAQTAGEGNDRLRIIRQTVVFDAADLEAESAFWAAVLGGRAVAEDDWHSIVDAAGERLMDVQFAPNHVPPEWPDGTQQQQIHLDLHVDDLHAAHDRVMALGARLLRPAADLDAEEGFQVYADPAGHPFCLCWG